MLRICFIGGYALFIIATICLMAIKVISVVGRGSLGQWAERTSETLFTPANLSFMALGGGILFTIWVALLIVLAKRAQEWERNWVRTLIIGCVFMSGFFLLLGIVGVSVFTLDGFAGEVAAKIAGFLSSPIFMELSFFLMGVFLLVAFLTVKRIFEGDEFVEIEVKDDTK